jgi:Peptidase family M28
LISFRIYRAGFAPALVAIVVLLFALTAPPDPLPGAAAPAEFDELAATRLDRQITDAAPDRTPGSEGDAAVAQMVEQHFRQVEGGLVSDHQFSGEFGGHDVDLRNVILTLPGDTERAVVVMAPRDSGSRPGAVSSAAATAVLLELVDELSAQSHTKTLVFVSTDGSSAGALGAREFATAYPDLANVDAVIDLWQPGASNPHGPFVLESSADSASASAQLVRTAEHQLADHTDLKQSSEGAFGELVGLALPSGLGEQAVLIEHGLTAVGLSSAGEQQLPPSQDGSEDLGSSTLGDIGRTALLLAVTFDSATAPLEHGPSTYVPLAGNLVPGWTLALLALTLLLPAALAAADGVRRGVRMHAGVGWAIGWAASRALPLFGALLFFYFLSLVGLVASPAFPFDPNLFGIGAGQILVMVVLALIVAGVYYAIRGWRVPAVLPRAAAVPALGVVSTFAVFIAWLANPYLALLLVPTAHVWVTCAGRRGPLPWPFVLGAGTLSLLPFAFALADVAGSLGSAAPWLLLLMVSDGQFGFWTMLALCLVGGGLLGIVAISLRGARPPASRPTTSGPSPEIPAESAMESDEVVPSAEPLDAHPITSSRAGDDLWGER